VLVDEEQAESGRATRPTRAARVRVVERKDRMDETVAASVAWRS